MIRRLGPVTVILAAVTAVLPASPGHTDPLALANPSFEQAMQGWTVDPSRATTAQVTDAAAHTGGHSLQIDDPADNSVLVRSAELPARAGAGYTADAWVTTKSGSPAWLYLEFWNAAGTRLAEHHVTPAAGTQWADVSVSGTAPDGTTSVTVAIYGSQSTSGVSYYDDAGLDGPAPVAYDPNIGSATQLFIDGYRTDSVQNASRVVHTADKHGKVLSPDRPWESNNTYVYGSAIYDEQAKIFKLWYQVYDRKTSQYFVCYATSRDGLKWDKPVIGDAGGYKDTNIVGGMHSATVVKDTRDPDPSRRYKMFGMSYGSGYWVWFSPDGLKWTPSAANPVLPDGDVANVTYDPATERFVATTKHPDNGRRTAFLSTSTDFEHWTEPKLIMRADDRDQSLAVANGFQNAQIYGMPILPYKGVYVGLPWVFSYGGAGDPGTAGDGPVDTEIAFSRDMVTWNRDDRTVVLPRGVGGSFDSGMTFTAGNVIERGGKIWLYYGGWDGLHGSSTRGASVALATWREDGFVSIANGGDTDGVVTTKPLVFTGSRLHVNAKLGPGQNLRVEVLDADGKPLPGYALADARTVTGDHTDTVVGWAKGTDVAALTGRQIRLRFHLHGGDLYSYRFDRS